MRLCSIIGCAQTAPNQSSLTIHRIPRNERKKEKWLEAIGKNNLKRNVKDMYICSLHFDEKSFNKTLEVIRLRDDAVPSKFVRQHEIQHKTGTLKENQLETISVPASPDTSTLDPLEDANTSTHSAPGAVAGDSGIATCIPCKKADTTVTVITPAHETLDAGTPILPKTTTAACTASVASLPGTSGVAYLPFHAHKIKKLENKRDILRKEVKKLNEKVRRQKKKIEKFKNIVQDLQGKNLANNKNSKVLKSCAGSKDFLKRHFLKSEGLPSEKQYSEETRKFALRLHLFSPKAYNFMRRAYSTCLPHPRTLTRWYQKMNAENGLCKKAFEALQNKD